MEQAKKHLAILNLSGEFIPELADYFISRGILVVDPLSCKESYDWTHIITKDVHDFTLINKTYEVSEKERSIISLTKVDDLQNFVLNNGNIVIDECWFKAELGGFILDKYFIGHAGINLKDNYPTFKELGSFNVANPFNTGEYLDKLTQKAFKEGMDGLSIKTYFDHLLMFISGLKNKGKAGLPFEVTYGMYQEVFGVQIHFFAKNLELLDVTNCLRSTISKRAEEYYLNVAVQSSDFFEFSFLPEVDKAIVTALWSKDERIKYENRSFMISSITGNQALVKYLTNDEELSDFAEEPVLEDFSEKVVPPQDLPEEVRENFARTFKEEKEVTTQEVVGEKKSSEEALTVETLRGELTKDQETRVRGTFTTKDEVSKVTGGPVTKDEVSIIKGSSILEEIVETVKGKVEEEKPNLKIRGDRIDIDKLAIKISTSYTETSEKMNLQVRSLGNSFPHMVKTGLYDFSKNLNKPIDELNDEEIDRFQVSTLAEIIRNELISSIIKDKDLGSEVLKQQIRELETKLESSKDNNSKLSIQMTSLLNENQSLKERDTKLLRLQEDFKESSKDLQPIEDRDEELRKHFSKKLSTGKPINDDDIKKLSSFFDREARLVRDLRNEELKNRKLAIESVKKEALLAQEIQNTDKKLRAKDLVNLKAKETLTQVVSKKDEEITTLRARVEQLKNSAATASPKSYIQKINDLEKQNQNLYKQIEKYKEKMTNLSSMVQILKSEDESKEENRKNAMMNLQLKNQLSQYQREMEKLKLRLSHEMSLVEDLRAEKSRLEQSLKKQSVKERKDIFPISDTGGQTSELKSLMIQNQSLETQIKDYSSRIAHLETKLSEAQRPSKIQASGDESKVKFSQFEASLKKLSQDNADLKSKLDETKKEINKLRQEKTALQNLADKLKKDADKGKPATPKKPGGKAA